MKKYALATLILLCLYLSSHEAIIIGFSQEKQLLEKEIWKAVELLKEYTWSSN